MRADIFMRTLDVMRAVAPERRRYKELEEETGIPATNWQSAAKRKQRPTAAMIEALGRRWPQYAFWMATGLTDAPNGHTAPPDAWTCNEELSTSEAEHAAVRYFELKILVQDAVYGMADHGEIKEPGDSQPAFDTQQLGDFTASSVKPEVQNIVDKMFSSPGMTARKSQSDLDGAIARIAYEKRKKSLQAKFKEINPNEGFIGAAQTLKERLAAERHL